MHELAKEDKIGFNAAVFDFTALGEYEGFCQQEWYMDSKPEVKHYIMPNRTLIVHAFTIKNFIMFDESNICLRNPLLFCQLIQKLGIKYDVQKNRRNGQIIAYLRFLGFLIWCPVKLALNILAQI